MHQIPYTMAAGGSLREDREQPGFIAYNDEEAKAEYERQEYIAIQSLQTPMAYLGTVGPSGLLEVTDPRALVHGGAIAANDNPEILKRHPDFNKIFDMAHNPYQQSQQPQQPQQQANIYAPQLPQYQNAGTPPTGTQPQRQVTPDEVLRALGFDFIQAVPGPPTMRTVLSISGPASLKIPIICHHIIVSEPLVLLMRDKRVASDIENVELNLDASQAQATITLNDGVVYNIYPPIPHTVSFEIGCLHCTMLLMRPTTHPETESIAQ